MSRGRSLFRDRGLRAKKSFGQCFLADANIARLIAREAIAELGGTALEIGAGTGSLTAPLLQRADRVLAIERDRDLIPILQDAFAESIDDGRLVVLERDAGEGGWDDLLNGSPAPHVIVGNVPYQITGKLLERATEVAGHVERVVFMVQKEVADRIHAPTGTKDYGALSVFVRRCFRVVRRVPVPPTCFRPQPSVHSTVLVLEPRVPAVGPADELLRKLVLMSFSRRRKTLRNAWRGAFGLEGDEWEQGCRCAGVDLDDRAERLRPEDFDRVADWLGRRLTQKP